jgi:hypothetical protein
VTGRNRRAGLRSIGVNPDHRQPWPPALLSRLAQAMEAVERLDIDGALVILSGLVGDVGAIVRAELSAHHARSRPTSDELARWREIVDRRAQEQRP